MSRGGKTVCLSHFAVSPKHLIDMYTPRCVTFFSLKHLLCFLCSINFFPVMKSSSYPPSPKECFIYFRWAICSKCNVPYKVGSQFIVCYSHSSTTHSQAYCQRIDAPPPRSHVLSPADAPSPRGRASCRRVNGQTVGQPRKKWVTAPYFSVYWCWVREASNHQLHARLNDYYKPCYRHYTQ